ncbi:MAG: hypothetical protein QM765_39905 [Myxococcales bacterium]
MNFLGFAAVLAFIHGFTGRRGYAPSFEKIGAHFGATAPSVNSMLKTLERNGLLARLPRVARSLRVLVPPADLPPGDFGVSAPRAAASSSPAPAASTADAAALVAIAVLDAVLPHCTAAGDATGDVLVAEAARAVRAALVLAGTREGEADEAARRVLAEAARWTADGRGIVQRPWKRRP